MARRKEKKQSMFGRLRVQRREKRVKHVGSMETGSDTRQHTATSPQRPVPEPLHLLIRLSRRRRPLGPLKLLQLEPLPWIRLRVHLQLGPLLPLVLLDSLARLGRQSSFGDRSGGSGLRERVQLLGRCECLRIGRCRCSSVRTEHVLSDE